MIKMKVSTKVDFSGLKKLQKQLRNVSVDIGYIDSKDHWMSKVPVAQVASSLHYYSPWADSFMLSETKRESIKKLVHSELTKLGFVDIYKVADCIGREGVGLIEVNIKSVNSPRNSTEWADFKGFNDPLVFGSRTGEEPNLISELTYKVNG